MPNTYTPVLRPRSNEQQVIQRFGGLSPYIGTGRELNLQPVLEVATEEDLNQLDPFRDAAEELFIDLPEYFTNRHTKYSDLIARTIQRYGSREEFFRRNHSYISVPTVSSFAQRPVEYGIHISMQMALAGSYSRIAHRLMIRIVSGGLRGDQKSTLKEFAEIARPGSDVILFDVVDVGYEKGGPLDGDLDFLTKTFQGYETCLLNVFDAFENQPENFTPSLADRFDCEKFGDFAIDKRFPPDDGGRPPAVNLRHYYPNHERVEVFHGENYEEAARNLVRWDDYEADHCEFCRQATHAVNRDQTEDTNLWKRIRMGHYLESTLQDQI